jgi:hypothetical protein
MSFRQKTPRQLKWKKYYEIEIALPSAKSKILRNLEQIRQNYGLYPILSHAGIDVEFAKNMEEGKKRVKKLREAGYIATIRETGEWN